MSTATAARSMNDRLSSFSMLALAAIFGIAAPIIGTLVLSKFFSDRTITSLPIHSTLEVAGAALGMVLAAMILFSRQKQITSRRMWISLALASMAVFDITHSCVPAGVSFVWLHSLAVLAGGIFFAMVYFPEREISRNTALSAYGAVILVTMFIGILSALYPESIPAMKEAGRFSPVAIGINLAGGGLTILASINFAVRYYTNRNLEEVLFLLLCLLFGISGVLFQMSSIWETGWWLWHVLRFGAYVFAFSLALISYRNSEEEMTQTNSVLDKLFHASMDGKRIVDQDFNQLQVNDILLTMAGISRKASQSIKCHEALRGPFCHTDECPIKQFSIGMKNIVEEEVTKITYDGREIPCLFKAVKLNGPDGSFQGIVESFVDISERKAVERNLEQQNALKNAQAKLADLMRGDLQTEDLCRNIITFVSKHLNAQSGLLYLANGAGLKLVASYAHKHRRHIASEYKIGEGLVGQAALEKEDIVLTDVPREYIMIESGLGQAVPRNIFIKPLIHDDKVKAVMELGTIELFADFHSQFLDLVSENIAIAVESSENRNLLAKALKESQQLTEELQSQQEELRVANEELEEQTQRLQESEEKLKNQQEDLEVTNAELEEKNDLLDRQKKEVEGARKDIEKKAEELAIASKYKSEFLANMSHELRTPLNSLLLLAQGLEQNKEGNLTADQLESARIIHGSGTDLLNLINEILDLSKIEAGRMDLLPGKVHISDLADAVRASFQHMAQEKGIELHVIVSEDAPGEVISDRKRIEQIVRNLISNALKFTESGSVAVTFGRPALGTDLSRSVLSAGECLAIAVKDTGIGISPDHQKVIFEAFQQVDGSTTRKFGGTGLGLSISRELARLLGGEIQVESELGKGSTFTLYLPLTVSPGREVSAGVGSPISSGYDNAAISDIKQQRAAAVRIEDDRDSLKKDDRVILVIEDDSKFALLLYKKCHEKGFKCLAAPTGEEGLELAAKYLPAAVILDIRLPGMDGWAVLTTLKEETRTRHIPVHIMSVEEASTEALRMGAVGHATKPLKQEDIEEAFRRLEQVSAGKKKRILVVEDDATIRRKIVRLIGNGDVKVEEAENGEQAMQALRSDRYDCVVLDLGLPDMDGGELLARFEHEGVELPPVIIHTARDLTQEEEIALRERAESIVIKDARSQERLLDEVSLFLHRMVSSMPPKKKQMILNLHDTDTLLKDKKVLIVDDDMRSTFALSNLLAGKGMRTLKAENGERALRMLNEEPNVDLVLMDIMMPGMDGYEVIERIRTQDEFQKLPIIALTAKAMPEDRAKCITAGASDYLPKPVDDGRLISMMRVWLHK